MIRKSVYVLYRGNFLKIFLMHTWLNRRLQDYPQIRRGDCSTDKIISDEANEGISNHVHNSILLNHFITDGGEARILDLERHVTRQELVLWEGSAGGSM